MNPAIHNLLQSLGETINAQLIAANDRAASAEARTTHLVNGLRALVGEISAAAPEPSAMSAVPTPPVRHGTASGDPDKAFLAALGTQWIGAGKLREVLAKSGLTVAEGTVYNRMRKLAATYADMIEVGSKPERWRLKIPVGAASIEETRQAKPAMLRKSQIANGAQHPMPVATNDNIVEAGLFKPIIHHGDCLEIMKSIPDGSVDLILADPPYATTACTWDEAIPLEPMWEQYRRIIKPTGAVILFGSQPFTTKLAASNLDWFKYALVWEKNRITGFLHAKNKFLKSHEDILIFSSGSTSHAHLSKKRMTYNPQGVSSVGTKKVKKLREKIRYMGADRHHKVGLEYEGHTGYPRSVLRFPKDETHHHPFAKPEALLEYLIRTFSHEGELVVDSFMGSGSTMVAAMRANRRSIGIELDQQWFEVAKARTAAEASRGLLTAFEDESFKEPIGGIRLGRKA